MVGIPAVIKVDPPLQTLTSLLEVEESQAAICASPPSQFQLLDQPEQSHISV